MKRAITMFAKENNIDFAWQSRFYDTIIRSATQYSETNYYIQNYCIGMKTKCTLMLTSLKKMNNNHIMTNLPDTCRDGMEYRLSKQNILSPKWFYVLNMPSWCNHLTNEQNQRPRQVSIYPVETVFHTVSQKHPKQL